MTQGIRSYSGRVFFVLLAILVGLSIFFGSKVWGMYIQARVIEQKMDDLFMTVDPTMKLEEIPVIAIEVKELRGEVDLLYREAKPYFWLTPLSNLIPKYGGTLSQAPDLIILAQYLTAAADELLMAVSPKIETMIKDDQPIEVLDLVLHLQENAPHILETQLALTQAQEIREQIDVERLTPKYKRIIINRIDPLFGFATKNFSVEDAITLLRIAPTLLGSGEAGPQTYLILIQNEDELRPTGGFLTAVGNAVVREGELTSIEFQSSDRVDNLDKPFPIPPWQFSEFMGIEMFLFRDSNWFTDFPTTASWADYFYTYSREVTADGILAIDMQVIVKLLEVLGPVRIEKVSVPITSKNVKDYLRSAEESRPRRVKGPWDRKQFIGELAKPLLRKILNAKGQTWRELTPALIDLLNEKHILLQMDDEETRSFLDHLKWDGAVQIPQNTDFLMVVDTNMGYNKSNAVMESEIEYRVELSDPLKPIGRLVIRQINHSRFDLPCKPWATSKSHSQPTFLGEIPDKIYNMDECHLGYIRIYTPAETRLLESNPHEIPAEATVVGEIIPARTDDLGNDGVPGAKVFGMMVITPTQGFTETEFIYRLPVAVQTQDNENGLRLYHLKVQKQPGTIAQHFTLSLNLPAGAQIEDATVPFTMNDGVWQAELDMRRDLVIDVSYRTQ